jgi:hypothetical protein
MGGYILPIGRFVPDRIPILCLLQKQLDYNMDSATHLPPHLKNPESWRVLLFSAALLGIYLAIIIAGFQRIRKQHSLKLAAFLFVLSMLQLQLANSLWKIPFMVKALDFAGTLSLFLIGPLSLELSQKKKYTRKKRGFYLQFLPSLAAAFLFRVHETFSFWVYLAGGVSTGIYLVVQVIRLKTGGFRENVRTWMGRFTLIQTGMFIPIAIAGLSAPALCGRMITSVCLSSLIVVIWIRLMHTAISSYIK